MNELYEVLEICLQEIEQGADVEIILLRYPDLADELRPILEASAQAKGMAVPAPSPDVVRRNRVRLLQRAAEMRGMHVKPSSRQIWFASLRRMAVTLVVIAALFVSGTGLVRAASTTLPGDNLYSVKRTWEDVRLLFTFDIQKREALEFEHENERLEELRELLVEGRSAEVDFAGRVTRQNANEWLVAGFPVVISPQTDLPNQQVVVGDGIRVKGFAQSDGMVLAERIDLLPPGANLPEAGEDSTQAEEENHQGPTQQGEDDSGSGSGIETLEAGETKTPEAESETKEESFEGFVDSMNGNLWIINGQTMDVSTAEIKGSPSVGAVVKVEGYLTADGVFIVTKIELIENGSNSGSGSGLDDNDTANNNENGNDNGNETENGNDGNSNGDDGGGGNGNEDNGNDGGGNSGSGGGGDD